MASRALRGRLVFRRGSHTVFETRSALSGRVRVIDDRRERRLVVAGDTLSAMPLNGDWSQVHREYWWHALTSVPIPPRPTVLLVGLGGGTQLHLIRQLASPRMVTVIEHDPVILQVAHDWFGLREIGGVEYVCGDAHAIVPALARARRRFDFVMEDVAYADRAERALPLALALVRLVAAHGVLVINRHRRGEAGRLADALRPHFTRVRIRRVRREGENALICCQHRLRRRGPAATGMRGSDGGGQPATVPMASPVIDPSTATG